MESVILTHSVVRDFWDVWNGPSLDISISRGHIQRGTYVDRTSIDVRGQLRTCIRNAIDSWPRWALLILNLKFTNGTERKLVLRASGFLIFLVKLL